MKEAIQQQEHKIPQAIADALETLRAREKKIADANATLAPLDKAIAKSRKLIDEKANTIRRIAELRSHRRTLKADEALGQPDTEQIATLDRELETTVAKLKEIAPDADDAESVVIELERRRAANAGPIAALSQEIPSLQMAVLNEAMGILLSDYARSIELALDRYTEVIAFVPKMNQHGRAAGLQQIFPEVPSSIEWPGITFGKFKLRQSNVASPAELGEARKRLAVKLQDLGVTF